MWKKINRLSKKALAGSHFEKQLHVENRSFLHCKTQIFTMCKLSYSKNTVN